MDKIKIKRIANDVLEKFRLNFSGKLERGDGVMGGEGMHCSYGTVVSLKVDNQQGKTIGLLYFSKNI